MHFRVRLYAVTAYGECPFTDRPSEAHRLPKYLRKPEGAGCLAVRFISCKRAFVDKSCVHWPSTQYGSALYIGLGLGLIPAFGHSDCVRACEEFYDCHQVHSLGGADFVDLRRCVRTHH